MTDPATFIAVLVGFSICFWLGWKIKSSKCEEEDREIAGVTSRGADKNAEPQSNEA